MTRGRVVSLLTFYAVYAAVYVGWWFHRSTVPAIGGYSASYLAFLAAAAVPFGLPALALWAERSLGRRNALFALVTCGIGFVVVYGLAGQVYYHTRVHRFDPFLQMPPSPLAQPKQRTPGRLRILALGGSTTRCGLLDEADRYPVRLEADLRASGIDVEVLNAGADWWTSEHSLIHYVTSARQWQPDVVVVMHAINDMYRSFETPEYTLGPYNDRWSHFYGPSIQGALPPTFEATVFELPIASWFSRLRIRPARMPLEVFRSIVPYERHLAAIVDYVRADGAEVVLVTQPSLYGAEMSQREVDALWLDKADFVVRDGYFTQRYADPTSLARAMEAYNAVVVRVAAEKGVALARAAEAVPRDLDHFADDVHYQPPGARRVAEVVADTIRSAGLAKTRRISDP